MPIVRIDGAPLYWSVGLSAVEERIKEVVASVPELNIGTDEISVLFPMDGLKERSSIEIIATIDGLFKRPERTDEVRQNLANEVVLVLSRLFGEASLVECFVKPFDPKLGFATFSR